MKIYKLVVSGTALASFMMIQEIAATPVMAATTSIAMKDTHIYFNGKNIYNPEHVVAKDPWSGVETAWVPMSFVQQALKQVGFETTWNGTSFTFSKYPPGWKAYAALGNPEAPPAIKNQIQINLVAGAPPSADIPKFVAKSPTSGMETTYMPIYYLDNILNHYWRMGAVWDGIHDNWTLHSQQVK
jgi:hypothetical protein